MRHGGVDPSSNPDLVADCEVLLSVRDSLRGTGELNWGGDTPIGEWDGVTLTGSRVTELELRKRELTGVIPGGLSRLDWLTVLRLEYNELTGEIPPELGDLSRLRWLWLFRNDLTGEIPEELTRASGLNDVNLSGNRLTGTIPSAFADLEHLRRLRLHENRLTGEIPEELGGLDELQRLYLQGNRLTGGIPEELARLSELTDLLLNRNELTGGIPEELGELEELVLLFLSANRLTGGIPPELGNLRKLTELQLDDNRLTGEIPEELGGLSNLTHLYLSYNGLSGRMPGSLTRLEALEALRLRNNELEGCLPSALARFAEGVTPQQKGGGTMPACRPLVDVHPTEGLVTRERGRPGQSGSASFTVALLDSPTADVRIRMSSSDPGEGTPSSGELHFPRHTWYVTQTVFVDGVDDDARDGDQGYTIVLDSTRSADPRWVEVDPPDVTLTNLDDEMEGPPSIEYFEAYPPAIRAGGEAVLYWNVFNDVSVTIEPGIGPVAEDTAAVRPEATTTYTLTATNIDGEATAEATVRVVPPPSIAWFAAEPDSVTRGDSARLEWAVEDADSVYVGDLNVTDSTGLAVAPEATTTYTLTAVDGVGESVTAEATVTVLPPATIASFRADPVRVPVGDTARLEWAVEDADSVYVGDLNVTDSTGLAVAPEATTTYTLAAVNALGDSTTAEATVLVVPPPTITSFAAEPDSVTRGDSAQLTWEVTGADSVYLDGGDVTGGSELKVAPDATTEYTLTAVIRVGETRMATTATTTVTVVPPAVIDTFHAAPDSVARGDTVLLAWEVSGADAVFLAPDIGDVTDATETSVVPDSTTTYTLIAVNPFGDSATARTTVTIVPPPVVGSFQAEPDMVAAGDSAQLTWEITGADSVYIDGIDVTGSTALKVAPDATTAYTLTAVIRVGETRLTTTAATTVTVVPPPTVAAFAAEPDSVTRADSAQLTWEVTGADSVYVGETDVTGGTALKVAPDATTEYTLTAVILVGETRLTTTATTTVTVVPPAVIDTFHAAPDSVARGDTVRLAWEVTGADAVSIEPDVGDVTDTTETAVVPDSTTTYTLIAVNPLGDSATARTTVTIVPPPVVNSFRVAPDTVALGDTARLEWDVEGADSVYIGGTDVSDRTELAVTPDSTTRYTLTAVNRVGDTRQSATAETTLVVVVNQPPEANIAIRDCGAGNYDCSYDGSGSTDPDDNIASYAWDMGDGTTLDGATVDHGYTAPGRYTVTLTVTDSAGATGTADTVQVVNLAPVADFTAACRGLACTFTSSATDDDGEIETWAWDFGDDDSGSDSVATHTYEEGGSYQVTLTVTDDLGAEVDTTRTVGVAPLAVIDTFWAAPDTITRADTARLAWQVEGADSVFIDPGPGNVTDTTQAFLAPDTTTTYTLAAVNAAGDSTTAVATVTVVPPPTVSITASATAITLGDTVTLSWSARNTTGGTVLGATFNGATSGSRRVTPGLGQTTYRITGRNAAGTTVTDFVTVTATAPPDPTLSASPGTITAGGTSTLNWTAHRNWTLSINQGIGSLPRGDGNRDVSPNATRSYTLTATLPGLTRTAAATVTVVPPPTVSITASATAITLGDAVTLSWSARNTTGGTVLGATFNGATSGSRRVTPGLGQTTYRITGRNAAGTTATDFVTVTATAPPDPTLSASPGTITAGGTSTLNWTAHRNWTLSINQGIGSVPRGDGNRDVSPNATRSYTLTATLPGLTKTAVARVTVVPAPTVSITASATAITLGDAVTLSWSARNTTGGTVLGAPFNGETSGSRRVTPGLGQTTYRITGWNAADSTVTDEVTVNAVDNKPTASFDVVYCTGLTCRFQSTSNDDITAFADLEHDWTFGDGNTGTGPSPTHTYSRRGSYTVTLTVTDESGQTDSATASVGVSEPPVARFSAGCNELDCVFDARQSSDDVGISEYFWTFGTETTTGELVSHVFDAAGTYSVTLRVTDTHGNVTYASGSVTTGSGTQRSGNTPPSPDFTVNCDGLGRTFTSTSTDDAGIVSWSWSTGDDTAAGTRAEHVHRYASPGTYTVNLAVRDERGALGVVAYWVTVTEG